MADCLSDQQIEELIVGPAGDPVSAEHLASCAACRWRADEIQGNAAFLDEFRPLARSVDRRAVEPPAHRASASAAEAPEGYEVLSVIAQGGQGVVHKAIHKATKRAVALKLLGGGRGATARERHRFEREIELVAGLRHPNIVTVYDSGTTRDGRHFLAMEYVEGEPLDAWNANRRLLQPAPEKRGKGGVEPVLRLFVKISDALNYAHQHGIIHRDLKPANILIDAEDQPRILDFGLAKAIGEDLSARARSVTLTGEFQGTLAYAAPEQVSGDPRRVDTRTDVYALGVVLYELLTGQRPYPVVGGMTDVLRNIAERDPGRPSAISPHLDDELDTIVLKTLAKDQDRRYQSAMELSQDLQRYLAGDAIHAKAESTWYVLRKATRRHKAALMAAGVFFALITAFAVIMSIQADRLADHRDRLTRSLSESNIERGRLIGLNGNLCAAENLLWGEFLRGGPPAPAVGADHAGSPADLAAHWSLWELYTRQPCLATVATGEGRVPINFSPDGRRLWFHAPKTGKVRIIEVPGGRLLETYSVPPAADARVCLTREGNAVAAAEKSGDLVLWDLGGAKAAVRVASGHAEAINQLAFSGDGNRLASADAAGEMKLWDAASGRCLASVGTLQGVLTSLGFSPNGQLLVSAGVDPSIRLWDIASGTGFKPLAAISDRIHPTIPPDPAFSPDGTMLAYIDLETIILWDVRSGRVARRLEGHGGNISGFGFSDGGGQVAVGGWNGVVKLYDLSAEKWGATYAGHIGPVASIRLSPDETFLATASNDGTIRIWEAPPLPCPRAVLGHRHTVLAAAFSADGRTLATADGGEFNIRLWDVATGRLTLTLAGHGEAVGAVAFQPSGARLASGGHDGDLKVWDVSSGALLESVVADSGEVGSVAFSPDGQLLASGGNDTEVKLWRAGDGLRLERRLQAHTQRIPCVTFRPDGRTLASTGRDGRIMLWDALTGEAVRTLAEEGAPVRWAQFSPDGLTLATACDEGTVSIWEVASGRSLTTLTGHSGEVYALSFNAAGHLLASGDRGGKIRLWDPGSGRCLAVLDGPGAVFCMAISPDGRTLAAGGNQPARLVLWDLGYYDRHIAGNLEYQLLRLGGEGLDPDQVARLRTWAAEVLARPLRHDE